MPETMLAVVKPEAAPGADIRQMPVPQIGPDDVLVKVKVASVCGTDLHIYNWDQWAQNRIKPPLIPGHEFCGHVVATGKNVTVVKEEVVATPEAVAADAAATPAEPEVIKKGKQETEGEGAEAPADKKAEKKEKK